MNNKFNISLYFLLFIYTARLRGVSLFIKPVVHRFTVGVAIATALGLTSQLSDCFRIFLLRGVSSYSFSNLYFNIG